MEREQQLGANFLLTLSQTPVPASNKDASSYSMESSTPSDYHRKRRHRTVLSPLQITTLRQVWQHTAFPDRTTRLHLARSLGLRPRSVQIWFQNARQKERQRKSSGGSLSASLPESPETLALEDEQDHVPNLPMEPESARASPVSLVPNPQDLSRLQMLSKSASVVALQRPSLPPLWQVLHQFRPVRPVPLMGPLSAPATTTTPSLPSLAPPRLATAAAPFANNNNTTARFM